MMIGDYFPAAKLDQLKKWFDNYTKSFLDREQNRVKRNNFILKMEHTENVIANIIDLLNHSQSADLGMLQSDIRNIAECIALFHDLGRFEQIGRYNSFNDKQTMDHAEFSVVLLRKNGLLNDIPKIVREIIYLAILYHNKKEIPGDINANREFFIKLIRDADKIDIYRILDNHYAGKDLYKDPSVSLNLIDDPRSLNEKVVQDLLNGKVIDKSDLKYVNDFKIMQISWLYDLNFNRSFQILAEKRYIKRLFDYLPKMPQVESLKWKIKTDFAAISGLMD